MQKRNVSIVLRELLGRDRISPTELYRRTGVPQSTLSRILSGKIVDPSDKHISRIAEYFASAPINCADVWRWAFRAKRGATRCIRNSRT